MLVGPDQYLGGLPSVEAKGEDHTLYVRRCVGLHRLEIYGLSVDVAQPAIPPGIEAQERFRLDEALPRGLVGVDDHDLLLVDRRQATMRPAPGGLDGDLLAGYPGPALHRPDRIPGRRYRGAGQYVV